VQGHDQHMILNIGYLLEALEALDTAQVALEMTESSRPVALKPIGPEEYVYIMMPIRSQQPASASAQENRSEMVPVS
jgi:DNA polymerase-3 subunit beta